MFYMFLVAIIHRNAYLTYPHVEALLILFLIVDTVKISYYDDLMLRPVCY